MTKEELREHCEKQVKMCEEWAKGNDREPSGKIYEEHKLILDLIKALEQQPSDCISVEVYKQVMSERDIAIEQLKELGYGFGEKIRTSDNCVSKAEVNKLYDEYRPRLATHVSEFGDKLKSLPPVTPLIPKGATNGNIMTAMFPDIKIHEHEKTDICDAYIQIDIWDFSICVSKDWWDALYRRGNEE